MMGNKPQSNKKTSKDDKYLYKHGGKEISLLISDESNNLHTLVVQQGLLLTHSPILRDMILRGELKKSRKIKLNNVSVIGVQKILGSLEKESLEFNNFQEAIETLHAAKEFLIDAIPEICGDYLGSVLDAGNVCEIYEFALKIDLPDLIYKCLKIIDSQTDEVIKTTGFESLKQSSVMEITKRSTLSVSSEAAVFGAVLKWSKSEAQRRGLDAENVQNLKETVCPLLPFIRFLAMSDDELSDPNVSDYHSFLCGSKKDAQYSSKYRRSVSESVAATSQPRCFSEFYTHQLEVFDSHQPALIKGETFGLTVEILKGKAYLCGVSLGLTVCSLRMSATGLYTVLCATNKVSMEQRKVRGTFMTTSDDAMLIFSTPLFMKNNDIIEIALSVKMSGNVSPYSRKNDSEIIVPESKDLGMKILADNSVAENVRCIYKEIIYFF